MAIRSLANATLSFGLVSIPVRLFTSIEARAGISFHLLHGKCGSRVKQQYFCVREKKPVERSELVKGFETGKDEHVIFTAEELKKLEEKSTQSIDIAEFIPADAIDPVYYSTPYYLGPDHGGDKAYRLLSTVLEQSEKVAVARYAARGKEYLAVVRPLDGKLVMQQLHYSDEVRPISGLGEALGQGAAPKSGEIELALKLVEQGSSSTFDPKKYNNDVRDRIRDAIERKTKGKQAVNDEAPHEPRAQVIDLVDALRKSLAGGDSERRISRPSRRLSAKRAPAQAPGRRLHKSSARKA